MFVVFLFLFAIVCSLMSQLPFFVEGGGGGILKVMWIFPFAFLAAKWPRDIFSRALLPSFLFLFVFGFYCFAMQSITDKHYIGTDLTNVGISTMITVVSYMFWKRHGSNKVLSLITVFVLISCLILAYVVNNTYMAEMDIMSRLYAYQEKNSTSTILYCAVLLSFFVFSIRNRYIKYVIFLLILYLTYNIMILRSRATIIGFAFVLYYFVFKSRNTRVKVISIFLTIAAVVIVFSIPSLYKVIVEGILFAARDVEDFNDLTSGRTYLISEGIDMFTERIWFGRGNLYMDCMPLVMLVQYGVVGASVVFAFLFFIGKKVNAFLNNNNLFLVTFLLFYSFILNSLFEAQPPFGPGIKCFMLWMMIGFSMAELEENKIDVDKQKSLYDMIKS